MNNKIQILFSLVALFTMIAITSPAVFAQNLLSGSDMESGDDWTIVELNSATETTVEFGYTGDTPSAGEGGALRLMVTVEQDQMSNVAIYQQVTLVGGETYQVDGAFRDIAGLEQFWAELIVSDEAPVEGEDIGGNLRGMNAWDGCADGVDGTFLEDGCTGEDDGQITIEGEGEVTMYFILKVGMGSWDGLVSNSYEVTIDDLSLTNVGTVSTETETRVLDFALKQNYPNPFNPTTTINYQLAETSIVTLDVFNIMGQHIATLVNTSQSAGSHSVQFDASNLASGLYMYQLRAGDFVQTRKMHLIK